MNYQDKDSKTCFEQNEQLLSYEQEIKELNQYKEAYNLMCDETWSLIPDEEKASLHKKLDKIFGITEKDTILLEARLDRILKDYEAAKINMNKIQREIAAKHRKKN